MPASQERPLSGKVAVVTGGAQGIGWAIASALASRGATVIVTSRDLSDAEKAAASLGNGAVGCACDVRDEKSVSELFALVREKFGALDVLVNNAGLAGPNIPVEELAFQTWKEIIDTNLTGTFLVTRSALPLVRPGGSVVFNLSITAKTVFPGMSAYAASKHGALGLANTLREELRPRGIRVISLLSGATDTEIWKQFWPDAPRQKMLSPKTIAEATLSAVLLPPEATVNEIVIAPTAGNL